MKPQNSRYFNHNGAKYRILNKSGVLHVFKLYDKKPLGILSTPASVLITDDIIEEARVLIGMNHPNEPPERTNYKGLALKFEVHTDTIRNKIKWNSWTISELCMLHGEPLDVPNDFYKRLYTTMYRKEITRKKLSEMMNLSYDSTLKKYNNEGFTKAEKYFITKVIL